MNTGKPRVFVSHSHQDNAFCRAFVATLHAQGIDAWYDEHNLGYGQLHKVIEQELQQRSVFIVLLSPDALHSKWVEDEASWFYQLYKDEPRRILLPVVATAIPEHDIWLFLRGFKRIETSNGMPLLPSDAARKTLRAMGIDTFDLSKDQPLPLFTSQSRQRLQTLPMRPYWWPHHLSTALMAFVGVISLLSRILLLGVPIIFLSLLWSAYIAYRAKSGRWLFTFLFGIAGMIALVAIGQGSSSSLLAFPLGIANLAFGFVGPQEQKSQ